MTASVPAASCTATWRHDLAVVLRRYGFLGLDIDRDGSPVTDRLRVVHWAWDPAPVSGDAFSVIVVDRSDGEPLSGIDVQIERGGGFLYEPRRSWIGRRRPVYRPLLSHVSFSGGALTPVWTTRSGRTVIGWWAQGGRRHLIIGLSVTDELVRYTQGDPGKVSTAPDKTMWGVGHERPAYLFEDNIAPGYELVPWADQLGFVLTRCLSQATGVPLLAPLPGGAVGAILITGDDDQAELEKYAEQLQLLDGVPITYMMLPHTRHTAETLARLPEGVEFGVHIDALERPDHYSAICASQTTAVRTLTGRPARTVRNHGHLNSGYWGHLAAWEHSGLVLDFNIRGLDGTCPTGSYLPFRVRRPDGSWSPHWALFSTFSDSMLFWQKWPEKRQIACITQLARQIETLAPGVIVVNFHPQNVTQVSDVHRALIALARKPRWVALGAESYLRWLEDLETIRLFEESGRLLLRADRPISDLSLAWPGARSSERDLLDTWSGDLELRPIKRPS